MKMKKIIFYFLFLIAGAIQVNALCVPHAVQGQVVYDGVAEDADGALVILINKNTSTAFNPKPREFINRSAPKVKFDSQE